MNCSSIIRNGGGIIELRQIFAKAKLASTEQLPSTIILKHFECIGVSREYESNNSSLVNLLLELIDNLVDQNSYVVLIATTTRPQILDPAFRRSERFDREFVVKVPSEEDRFKILGKLLPNYTLTVLREISSMTNGYVIEDLISLVREFKMSVARASVNKDDHSECNFTEIIKNALNMVGAPSLLKDYRLNVEKIGWSSLAGVNEIQKELEKLCKWPLVYKSKFAQFGIKQIRGILLYGPPGCSKTTIARILGNEIGYKFFSLSGASMFSSMVGESENIVRSLFARARNAAPSIIFLDEVDSIVGKRVSGTSSNSVQDRILSTMLNEMDGIENCQDVLVVVT